MSSTFGILARWNEGERGNGHVTEDEGKRGAQVHRPESRVKSPESVSTAQSATPRFVCTSDFTILTSDFWLRLKANLSNLWMSSSGSWFQVHRSGLAAWFSASVSTLTSTLTSVLTSAFAFMLLTHNLCNLRIT